MPPGEATYDGHRRRVQHVAGLLDRLAAVFADLELAHGFGELLREAQRVRSGRFTVAVVGEFKRGKSTLINALLGAEILPADPLPCSAAPFRVTFEERPTARVVFKDGTSRPIDFGELKEFGTKLTAESARRAADVAEVVVGYPLGVCRHGVEIIDTPGLNEDRNMTAVTLGVLPRADAAVLVMMSENPLSETEQAFVSDRLLAQDLTRVLFVVNAIDRVDPPSARPRVVRNVAKRVAELLAPRVRKRWEDDPAARDAALSRLEAVEVFPVSSRAAVRAKLAGDAAGLAASEFPAFESALERFLAGECGSAVVARAAARVRQGAAEAARILDLRRSALARRKDELTAALDRANAAVVQIRRDADAARQRFAAVRADLAERLRGLARSASVAIREDAERAIETVPVEVDGFNSATLPAVRERVNERVAAAVGRLVTAALDEMRKELARAAAKADAILAQTLTAARASLDAVCPTPGGAARRRLADRPPEAGGEFAVSTEWLGGSLPTAEEADTFESVAGFLLVASGAIAVATAGVGAGLLAVLGAFGVLSWLEEKVKGPKVREFREQCKAGVAARLGREASPEAVFERLRGPADAHLDRLRAGFDAELGGLVSNFADAVGQLRRESDRHTRDAAAQARTLDRLDAEVCGILDALAQLPQ
jgi:ribosome biogenesis GTPase A